MAWKARRGVARGRHEALGTFRRRATLRGMVALPAPYLSGDKGPPIKFLARSG